MFSPIFWTSAVRRASIVSPEASDRVAQRGDVGGVVAGDDLRDLGRERAKVVVLRDEVGFAVHLDHRRRLRVRRDETGR